jgi:hypothetical protein
MLFSLGILHGLSQHSLPDSNIEGRIIRANAPLFALRISGEAGERLSELAGLHWAHKIKIKPTNQGAVGEGYVFLPVEAVTREEYQGKVYNMEVDDDNSYVSLHGILHNCISKAARDLRRHALETIPIASRQGKDAQFFSALSEWATELMGIGGSGAVATGQYDGIYLKEAGTASNLRKQLEKQLSGLTGQPVVRSEETKKPGCPKCAEIQSLKEFITSKLEH